MHKNKNIGFTLIELMSVVAIIGLLTAIALPTYQAFTIRAKLIETLRFSDAAKTYLWEEYATNAYMPDPTSTAATNVSEMMLASKYIDTATYTKIDSATSSLEVTFKDMGAGADGKTMLFLLETDTSKIHMTCNQGTMSDIYRPSSCRTNN
ncbi:MAG: pilin [Thiolinea sp.]